VGADPNGRRLVLGGQSGKLLVVDERGAGERDALSPAGSLVNAARSDIPPPVIHRGAGR
jgi:hypothetical protein